MRVVAVISGGPSREHDVSAASGRRVLDGLDRRRYRPLPVLIDRDGSWLVDGRRMGGPLEGASALHEAGCEVVFLALHGPFGEDGTIQGFLAAAGLAYTCAGVLASALACDKIRARALVAAEGIPVARAVTIPPASLEEAAATLGFPIFVKNPHEGSSLGLALVRDEPSLALAVEELAAGCDRLLLEARVEGRELTGSVLENAHGEIEALPVVEIRHAGAFFDYHAKYTPQACEELVPAPVPARVAEEVQRQSRRVHALLGLRGMSRSDFIWSEREGIVFLETNSIPGLTPNSLLPRAAAAAGIAFPELLTRLVEGAARPGHGARMAGAWSASSPRSGERSTGSSTAPTAAKSSS